MHSKFIFQKDFEVTYEVKETNGIEMITVSIPKIGKKTTQLGSVPAESFARVLSTELFNEFEGY